jgi:hypothetical protein
LEEKVLERLEMKRGHHIPNPSACKVTTPPIAHSVRVTHSIF